MIQDVILCVVGYLILSFIYFFWLALTRSKTDPVWRLLDYVFYPGIILLAFTIGRIFAFFDWLRK